MPTNITVDAIVDGVRRTVLIEVDNHVLVDAMTLADNDPTGQ
jgi:hypothetical protein